MTGTLESSIQHLWHLLPAAGWTFEPLNGYNNTTVSRRSQKIVLTFKLNKFNFQGLFFIQQLLTGDKYGRFVDLCGCRS